MAKGQISKTDQSKKVVRVKCSDCRWFVRDTDGISFKLGTNEFFMGECSKELHPDTPIKQFADHERLCNSYLAK